MIPPPGTAHIAAILARREAEERIRETQQGLGRPIISLRANDHQIVAVGNTVHYARNWKTFPDFLSDYLKRTLGSEWGNAEIARPFDQRHPLMQWYDTYCRYQQRTITTPGQVTEAEVTGVVGCYLGLAYSLYLLDHNVELQARLVARLKNVGAFQGAYYELIVANTLIRAGFVLTLEDETDGATKHCEFAAVSKATGKRYWVEAKMRGVAGLLGKTDLDGTPNPNPISQLIPHPNGALRKPAADERLIFIDLNADGDIGSDGRPGWVAAAAIRLEQYESRELPAGMQAYVFVTNLPFHRMLDRPLSIAALPFGLGLADFNRPGHYRLSEAYRRKLKHIDAHHIADALTKYAKFPTTFDGSLPSEAFSGAKRIMIGETYHFGNSGGDGFIGTVTAASVLESEKRAYICVTDHQGQNQIWTAEMTDPELADYKAHPDAYFGQVQSVSRKTEDPYELFEFMMDANKGRSRESMLEHFAASPDLSQLQAMTDTDLLAEYCENLVAGIVARFPAEPTQAAVGIAGSGSPQRLPASFRSNHPLPKAG